MIGANMMKIARKKSIFLLIFLLLFVFVAIDYMVHNILNRVNRVSLPPYPRISLIGINSSASVLVSDVLNSDNSNNTGNKIIILWTPFFGDKDYVTSPKEYNCPINKCVFTSNRSRLRDSDAVMFHVRDVDLNDMPLYRNASQRWILLHHESPPNTPPNVLSSLEGLINWTATYRYGSDIFLSPAFQRRTSPNYAYNSNVNYAKNKTRMIVWLASNCNTASKRENYVEELKRTVTVDVYGQCGYHRCLPKMSARCLRQLSEQYRFILAFENSICRDYVTEKYFNALDYNIIPIVLGGSEYSKIAPKKSYIDALEYQSPRHLARYLIFLSKHEKLYNSYFKWKQDLELRGEPYSCQICRKLHDRSEPRKTWSRLNSWWFDEANCKSWSQPEFD